MKETHRRLSTATRADGSHDQHFRVESVHRCGNRTMPRWTWWLHGLARTRRFGLVGTDSDGRGLFLLQHAGDVADARLKLLGGEAFWIPEDAGKAEACALLARALEGLGWGTLSASPDGVHAGNTG